jgi:sulfate transport system ATP-binding protein
MGIEIRNIDKFFGSFQALKDISLSIGDGELVALLGPSGCGKTTLLRIIAGLERADRGSIVLDGRDHTHTHVRDRGVGFVFQHYALFRHMTVFENIAFGLRVKPRRERPSNAAIAAKVHQLLSLVQLDWLADRYPHQLSGGQRQRIALARALAVEPRTLLLDEPFGALDANVRRDLRRWLRRLHDELHVTSIFVTHDQEEAMEVADHIVIFNEGRLAQEGSPVEIYRNPASPFVSRFVSGGAFLPGIVAENAVKVGPWTIENRHALPQGEVEAHLRSDDILLVTDSSAPRAEVRRVHPGYGGFRVQLKVTGVDDLLETVINGDHPLPRAGDTVHVKLSDSLPVYQRVSA